MSLLYSVASLTEAIADVPTKAIEGLAEAQGVVFLKLTKLGCIITVRGGHGLAMLRDPDNKWSAPMAIEFGGFALGADIGFEKSEFVFFFQEKETCIAFMEGNATVSLNSAFAAGPVGYSAEVLTNSGVKGSITIVGKSVGMYAGVSLEFSGVKPDRRANMTQYNRRVEITDIEQGQIEIPSEFDKLYKILYQEQEQAIARLADVRAKAAKIETEAKKAAAEEAMEEAKRKQEEARKMLEEVTVAKATEEERKTSALAMKAKAARLEADSQKAAAERALHDATMRANRASNASRRAEEALEKEGEQEVAAQEAQKARLEQEANELREQARLAAAEAQKIASDAAEAEQRAIEAAEVANKEHIDLNQEINSSGNVETPV